MSKVVSVRFENLEFEKLEKMAKLAGKNIAQFVREKIRESIQQEMRETSLLERLIKMIENLQNFQPQNTAQGDSELQREIYKLLLFLCQHEKTVAEYIILADHKRKEYMQKRQEIEQKLGLEL